MELNEKNESELLDKNPNKVSIRGTNILYLLIMILLIVIGSITQNRNFNSGILITEFGLVALPVIVFIKLKKDSLRQVLRLNKLKLIDMLLVFLIIIFGYPVAAFLNLIGSIILSLFGQLNPAAIPVAGNFKEYFILLFVVAVSAGLCEELLFRGLMMRAYEGIGMWKSIIFTAVMFSFLHLNIQNIFAPAFLGILLGFLVYRTNSIFAGMLGHFTFNSTSVTLSYLVAQLPQYKNMSEEAIKAGSSTYSLILAAIPIGVISAFTIGLMAACIFVLYIRTQKQEIASAETKLGKILRNYKISWPIYTSIVIFVIMLILELMFLKTGVSIFDYFG